MGQVGRALEAGWSFLAAVAFSAVIVSLLAHTIYYGLILKYPANLIAPLMVLNPLTTVAMGILITDDPFDARMVAGTAVALIGVLVITVSPEKVARAFASRHS